MTQGAQGGTCDARRMIEKTRWALSLPSLQVNTRNAVSGALSSTSNKEHATPVGQRLHCSQLQIVSCGTSIRRASFIWVTPNRCRTRRTHRANSRIASASSFRSCAATSDSEVASCPADDSRKPICNGDKTPNDPIRNAPELELSGREFLHEAVELFVNPIRAPHEIPLDHR